MAALLRRSGILQQLTTRFAGSTPPNDFGPKNGALPLIFKRWATKKTGGSTDNSHNSRPKHLGLKKCGGEKVIAGNIIVRQRGTRFHPGDFVGMGRDRTIYALVEGRVRFETNKIMKRKWIHVDPAKPPPIHPLFLAPEDRPKPKRPKRPTSKEQKMKWWKQPDPVAREKQLEKRPLPALCLPDPLPPMEPKDAPRKRKTRKKSTNNRRGRRKKTTKKKGIVRKFGEPFRPRKKVIDQEKAKTEDGGSQTEEKSSSDKVLA